MDLRDTHPRGESLTENPVSLIDFWILLYIADSQRRLEDASSTLPPQEPRNYRESTSCAS